ncbi:MAG: amidohydrolase [Erysipelotrichaceae bacterium]|nr:amidohydrolase [Erysipelotrichaceae bacterium]
MKKLFYNGTIYTMDENQPTAKAVAIENDKIVEVYQEIPTDWDGEKVDLNQNVMFPGFIDGHSHFVGCANALSQCDLSQAYSFDEIVEAIKTFIQDNNIQAGQWVVANNYDHNFLKEKAHPDRNVLDRISTDIPIMLVHVSNHMGVVNTAGLKMQNINDDVVDPQGGKYGRFEDHSLSGYMEENAFINFQKSISSFDLDVLMANVAKAQELYAKYGITTIQDGMVTKELYPLYQLLAHQGALKMDVVGYIDLENSRDLYINHPENHEYHGHFRLGGYKIFLDGSPQGRTAWMKEPYTNSNDCAYPVHSDEHLYQLIHQALADHAQLLAHCNGDAAAKQYVDTFEKVRHDDGVDQTYRPVMIHAQFVANDELKRMKSIEMMPSFFVAHTYYWGDIHIENLGYERASRMSAVKDAINAGLRYTFHQDTPVLMPDMMKTVACAVKRVTKNGVELSQEQSVSVKEALAAITINAAYQYHEEDRKGSIEKGKQANFTILEKDPFKVDVDELENIQVAQTIVDGSVIYSKH